MLVLIPGDDHYLGVTWLLSLALQMVCFAVAYILQVRAGGGGSVRLMMSRSTHSLLEAALAHEH